jgi:peptidyl-prolyl cis-trans isomerase D
VTPLDVFQAYRDQQERLSVRALGFRVEDFLSKVSEPTPSQITEFFDRYKNDLPNPDSPNPGFKVPRQATAEILSIDADALAKTIQAKLTDAELQTYYENRKSDFKRPSEFPDQIFAGDEKLDLTPPQVQPFAEVRPYLATSLAEERALTEVTEKFNRIKDGEMLPFADAYLDASDAIEEAKKAGESVTTVLPAPKSLKEAAQKEGLEHEITPALTRERAERYGLVAGAEVGMNRLSGGKKFAEELFDDRAGILEPIELTDFSGRRCLVRKLSDSPPRVPTLEEVRSEVILAWKADQARPLAEKAARDFAESVRKAGGKIEGEIVDGKPVITTDPITKLQPGLPLPGRFLENAPPTPTEIPQMPNAGAELRDAYFGLADGEVALAPNAPKSVYYVMTVGKRFPASFASLYAPTGDFFRYMNEARGEAIMKRDEQWMNQLRAEAGLAPGWTPPDDRTRG